MKQIIPFVIGGAIVGVAMAALDISRPPAAMALGAFVLFVALVFVRALPVGVHAVYQAASPEQAERCPRCQYAPRTPTGWCAGCGAALFASSRPVSPAVAQLTAAIDADDWRTIRSCLAPRIRTVLPGGAESKVTRGRWVRRTFLASLAIQGTNRFEAAYGDPGDPSVSWTRAETTMKSRLGGASVSLTSITRYVHNADGIFEMAAFAEIPADARIPGGWVSAPERAA